MAQSGFGEVAEALRRTTVQVSSSGRGFGSGVILSSDGLIVTNAHVVRSSQVQVKLWDGRTLEAVVRFYKGESQEKILRRGRMFSCFPAHLIEQR